MHTGDENDDSVRWLLAHAGQNVLDGIRERTVVLTIAVGIVLGLVAPRLRQALVATGGDGRHRRTPRGP
jgi:hypothetical protein